MKRWRGLPDVLEDLADREETEAALSYERLLLDDDPVLLWCCDRGFADETGLTLHRSKVHGPHSHRRKP